MARTGFVGSGAADAEREDAAQPHVVAQVANMYVRDVARTAPLAACPTHVGRSQTVPNCSSPTSAPPSPSRSRPRSVSHRLPNLSVSLLCLPLSGGRQAHAGVTPRPKITSPVEAGQRLITDGVPIAHKPGTS
eukprot:353069-Chlamydomonas_euryale.AAC.16